MLRCQWPPIPTRNQQCAIHDTAANYTDLFFWGQRREFSLTNDITTYQLDTYTTRPIEFHFLLRDFCTLNGLGTQKICQREI